MRLKALREVILGMRHLKRDRREEFEKNTAYAVHPVPVRIQYGMAQLQYSPFQRLTSLQDFQYTKGLVTKLAM